MQTTLKPDQLEPVTEILSTANAAFNLIFPGDSGHRQAVHTVYGGAHIFKSDTAAKMGRAALTQVDIYAPNFAMFAQVLGLAGAENFPTVPGKIDALEKAFATGSSEASSINKPVLKAIKSFAFSEINSLSSSVLTLLA